MFALACQFVLAFGHVHLNRIEGGSYAWTISAGANGHTAVLASPSKKPANSLAGDVCAVCASINLASTVFIPTTPAAAPPISGMRVRLWSIAAIEPSSSDHLFFDARGPPRT
jgi:hypothetical protein